MEGSLNSRWARTLIAGLAAAGVRHAVISPGSRSTPLTLACLRHPGLKAHILLDERTAAFFALGLARATGEPVMLVCTSGSAPSNWHPAVTEADAAGLPLILLTSDRPPELQDCGANQTVDQSRLFGGQLRAFHALPPAEVNVAWLGNFAARAVSQSLWPQPGPVQINVPLREPLLAESEPELPDVRQPRVVLPRLAPPEAELAALAQALAGRTGVIVAGPGALPAAALTRLARALDWPIIADPLSGLRFGGHDLDRVMTRGDAFLRDFPAKPEWVLRFGAFPVSKPVALWLAASGAQQVAVSADARWSDPWRAAAMMIHADPALLAEGLARLIDRPAPAGWCAAFRDAEAGIDRLLAAEPPLEAGIVASIVDGLPEGSLLFVGNSMAIRDIDSFSGKSPRRLELMCNRGASGIDGNLATFFGALRAGHHAAGFAVLGDLTFLHDVGGLAAGRGLDARLLVIDNGGGTIFDYLPQAGLPEFDAGWLTPQSADLAAAARLYGHHYQKLADPGGLADVLARPGQGVTILHLTIDRLASLARHRAFWRAARFSKETVS